MEDVLAKTGAKKKTNATNSPGGCKRTRQTNIQNVKVDSNTVAEIVTQVVEAVQPMIINIVQAAVTASTEQVLKRWDEKLTEQRKEMEAANNKVKKEVQCQKFELDKLEQYGRRENIKIFGVPSSAEENTNDIVVKVASNMGVNISDEDISISHRLPSSRSDRPKPIIVKFVRRNVKTELMKKKKVLREKEETKDIYIEEDLTPMRSKIVRELRNDKENVIRVWTIEGRIHCLVREENKESRKVINSPEDLLKIGWSVEKLKNIGVYSDI